MFEASTKYIIDKCLPYPDIYVDFDGTLTNFFQYFKFKFRKKIEEADLSPSSICLYEYKKSQKVRRFMNRIMTTKPIDFWSNMPANRHIKNIIKKFHKSFYVFASVEEGNVAMEFGKKKWLRYHGVRFKDRDYHRLLINQKKEKYAVVNGIRNILIDDDCDACDRWEAAGGIAYLYVDNWMVTDSIMSDIKKSLDDQVKFLFLC